MGGLQRKRSDQSVVYKLVFNLSDTKECDDALNVIYWRAAMEELIEYEDYEQFMIEFIV